MTNVFGYRDSRDVANLSLADYTEDRAMSDIQRFATDYTTLAQSLIGDLAAFGTAAKTQFGLGVGGQMQPFGEGGAVEATRPPAKWECAFPIYAFRGRKLYTEQFLSMVTMEELEKDIIQEGVAYTETLMKLVLNALMCKTNFTFDDGSDKSEWPRSGFGSLAVKRLCNADSAVGEVWVNGASQAIAALQHYFGSNAATMSITPFKTAYAKLKVVGMTNDVAIRVSPSDEDTVRGFAEFIPSPNPKVTDPNAVAAVVQASRAIGRLEGAGIAGEVIVQPFMPASYVFMHDRAGGDLSKPVYVRQHPLPQFQGWRLVQDETKASYGDASLRNKQWEYIAGAGVRNRVNGVAFYIVASTTYTDPTL